MKPGTSWHIQSSQEELVTAFIKVRHEIEIRRMQGKVGGLPRDQHLLNIYYLPHAVVGCRDMMMNKTCRKSLLLPNNAHFYWAISVKTGES